MLFIRTDAISVLGLYSDILLQNGNGKHSQLAVYFLSLVLTMSKPNDPSITKQFKGKPTKVRTKTNLKT